MSSRDAERDRHAPSDSHVHPLREPIRLTGRASSTDDVSVRVVHAIRNCDGFWLVDSDEHACVEDDDELHEKGAWEGLFEGGTVRVHQQFDRA